MRFELRTGLRGAGKSLGVVEELLEKSKNPDPTRPVYALNFTNLRSDLAEVITFDQLRNWKQFPPGSTIYVDEAQRFVPVRTSGEPPTWIRDFSESRHLAIDFVWVTQKPSMLDKHVRGLIDRHIHTVRKWGTSMVERYEWAECQDNPTSKSAVRCVDAKTRHVYSKEAQQCYTSAVMHTVETRVPPIMKKAVMLLFVVPALMFGAYWYVKHKSVAPGVTGGPASSSSTGASSSTLMGGKGGSKEDGKLLSPEEWVHRQVPRVAGIPWSAPIYDDQKPQTTPDLYCVEWKDEHDAKKCRCLTEQGTHAEVPNAMCVAFAEGGVYNPYRSPVSKEPKVRQEVAMDRTERQDKSIGQAVNGEAGSVGGPARERQTAVSYVPPTYGNWNPDPWGAATAK